MSQSYVQMVLTLTVEMSPERFIELYNPILIEKVGLSIHAHNHNMISPTVDDYEITAIEKVKL